MKHTFTTDEVIDILFKFADFADGLYRPYTRDNFQASEQVKEWVKDNVETIIKPNKPISKYNTPVSKNDSLIPVAEFKQCVKDGMFIDYDGWGYAVKDGYANKNDTIVPSEAYLIPKDATHIVWYNK